MGGLKMNDLVNVNNVAELELPIEKIRVAFASLDGDMVDQHFGSAQSFYLYAVDADNAELVTKTEFGQQKQDGNEDKLKPKLAWLQGADAVYCGSVGGSATRQLIALGVNPLKVSGGPDVEELIESLQDQLRGTPELWLARVLKEKDKLKSGNSTSFDEDLDWDE